MTPNDLNAIKQAWDSDVNAWDIIALHSAHGIPDRDDAVVHAAAFVGNKAQRDIAALVAEVERLTAEVDRLTLSLDVAKELLVGSVLAKLREK